MSKDMIDLIDKVAELTPEKRREFLVFGQGFVAGVELNKAEESAAAETGAPAPSAACGDSYVPEGARTGETDCQGAAPLAMTEDEGTPHQSPAATASPRGSRDGGAA